MLIENKTKYLKLLLRPKNEREMRQQLLGK